MICGTTLGEPIPRGQYARNPMIQTRSQKIRARQKLPVGRSNGICSLELRQLSSLISLGMDPCGVRPTTLFCLSCLMAVAVAGQSVPNAHALTCCLVCTVFLPTSARAGPPQRCVCGWAMEVSGRSLAECCRY